MKWKQIRYRVYYFLRNRLTNLDFNVSSKIVSRELIIRNGIRNNNSYLSNNTFLFLNVEHSFPKDIDWELSNYGKLWTYNLNYFDFLNQKSLKLEEGLNLIFNFIENKSNLKTGFEPYPISLRGINWIKFLRHNDIVNNEINTFLFKDYLRLTKNLEYHLLGNHLLENGLSLLFGAYYFENDSFYSLAKRIIVPELNEQILKDGGHFELSPMYHQIILWRLLDCISLVKYNKWKRDDDFFALLNDKAKKMLSFLNEITYSNGDIPMVNDSAHRIAPSSEEILNFASKLGLIYSPIELYDSGYRKVTTDNYELFVDLGEIGPSYQAGHAHADMLNFELYVNEAPFIVDTGTSTYENNELRQVERSTRSHNTVTINSKNQSEVWGGFRVGNRAKIVKLKHSKNCLEGAHDGYSKIVGLHNRQFNTAASSITITDSFLKDESVKAEANFHFYSGLSINIINYNSVEFNNGIKMKFESLNNIDLTKDYYQLAKGFNTVVKAEKLIVRFTGTLKTTIEI